MANVNARSLYIVSLWLLLVQNLRLRDTSRLGEGHTQVQREMYPMHRLAFLMKAAEKRVDWVESDDRGRPFCLFFFGGW